MLRSGGLPNEACLLLFTLRRDLRSSASEFVSGIILRAPDLIGGSRSDVVETTPDPSSLREKEAHVLWSDFLLAHIYIRMASALCRCRGRDHAVISRLVLDYEDV